MTATRRRLGMLACAALVVLAWRLVPAGSPPIYDGLCIASPYQLLGGNPPPSSATKSYPAGSNFPTSEIVTNESPPQVQVLMTDGTFVSPSPFTVTLTPIAPPAAPPPAGMAIDGNVYEIKAVTESGQMLQPQPQHPLTVLLRATSATPTRTMFRLDGTSWTGLKTFNAGCGDTFEAVSDRMGDFALMATPSDNGGAGGGGTGSDHGGVGGGGFPTALLVGVLIVVVLGSTIGLLRFNRTRRR